MHGSSTYEEGEVYSLKDHIYMQGDKLQIQETYSLFNNQEFLVKTFRAQSFNKDLSNKGSLFIVIC